MLLALILVLATANKALALNGAIQVPQNGEYCTNYFFGEDRLITFYDWEPDYACLGTIYGVAYVSQMCYWNFGSDCYSNLVSTGGTSEDPIYTSSYHCSPGCVSKLPCTPIPNARFTGPGLTKDDCPFECNPGYTAPTGKRSCTIGTGGPMQSLQTGEYCSMNFGGVDKAKFFPYLSYSSFYDDLNCKNAYYHYDSTVGFADCPWLLGTDCYSTRDAFQESNVNVAYHCSSGCILKALCTPIPNATFTGPGTGIDDCPFECKYGLTPSGRSCIVPCPNKNQYRLNNVCTDCQICPGIGVYNKGCGGTSNGTCTKCS